MITTSYHNDLQCPCLLKVVTFLLGKTSAAGKHIYPLCTVFLNTAFVSGEITCMKPGKLLKRDTKPHARTVVPRPVFPSPAKNGLACTKIWTGVKSGPPGPVYACEKRTGSRKVGRVFPAAVACPSMEKSDEDGALEHLDLVDELTESRYIDGCSAVRKRAIRKEAKMFAVGRSPSIENSNSRWG